MQCDGRRLGEISILYVGGVFSTGIFLQVQRVGWNKSSDAFCVIRGAQGWVGGVGGWVLGYAVGLKTVL